MIEFLNFTFQTLWHFIGVIILLCLAFQGSALVLGAIIELAKGKK